MERKDPYSGGFNWSFFLKVDILVWCKDQKKGFLLATNS